MNDTALLATDFRAVGLTVAALVLIAFVAFFIRNIFTARDELGSEIELAPNRKPYLADEDLEGWKLDRSLTFALIMLAILAVVLPFYWLAEPGRQDGAEAAYQLKFEVEGEETYVNGAQCVSCHAADGVGGQAAYVLQDADGQFLANANWYAPSLNDVLLRYGEEEVTYILNHGRPGSPMAAWGTPGGGPLTTQQVQNVIEYLRSIQVQTLDPVQMSLDAGDDPELLVEMEAEADALAAEIGEEVERSLDAGEFDTVGEAIFNLGLYSGFRSGGLSCARCHTSGWSLGAGTSPGLLDEGTAGCGGGDPSGIGFNLCNGSVLNRFPDDTWKRADGSWMPAEGLFDDEGGYIEAADGSKVRLDEGGNPITDDGDRYLVIDDGAAGPADPAGDGSAAGGAGELTASGGAGGDPGDLASCEFVSQLWETQAGETYPFAPGADPEVDETGAFVDPPELDPADVPGDLLVLSDGRLAGDCAIVEMPERTSQAHFDFIYGGAEAGSGYGRGGLSAAGMMPGFGGVLPPELIQAVVDYERGL
jgi:mono/diheme cytochrome c family protein